ncbi:MAG: DNA topoisomerase, partial [Oscillospiraceae bacterium]|nr:DNA topoisomerase [Oscillospiraceae bacterium]
MAKRQDYGNESITMLKGADKVRKRPGVIFGSDGLDGCAHSVFEIISNSIDEARAGFGDKILITRWNNGEIEVEDFGRGCPVDFNKTEQRYNWELVYCELYAGGKYEENSYDFSLGLNGLGLCATQYASEFMDVTVHRDNTEYNLHFEKGENVGGLQKKKYSGKITGTKTRWKPDLDVFTDIHVPDEFFHDILRRQAVVNAGLLFIYRSQQEDGSFLEKQYFYQNGISDYIQEIVSDKAMTSIKFWTAERVGRDRADKPDYKVKLSVALAFSNKINLLEYYHNSSFLQHGGSPDKAVRSAFLSQINSYLKANNKFQKNESVASFDDIKDCLALVS